MLLHYLCLYMLVQLLSYSKHFLLFNLSNKSIHCRKTFIKFWKKKWKIWKNLNRISFPSIRGRFCWHTFKGKIERFVLLPMLVSLVDMIWKSCPRLGYYKIVDLIIANKDRRTWHDMDTKANVVLVNGYHPTETIYEHY